MDLGQYYKIAVASQFSGLQKIQVQPSTSFSSLDCHLCVYLSLTSSPTIIIQVVNILSLYG